MVRQQQSREPKIDDDDIQKQRNGWRESTGHPLNQSEEASRESEERRGGRSEIMFGRGDES